MLKWKAWRNLWRKLLKGDKYSYIISSINYIILIILIINYIIIISIIPLKIKKKMKRSELMMFGSPKVTLRSMRICVHVSMHPCARSEDGPCLQPELSKQNPSKQQSFLVRRASGYRQRQHVTRCLHLHFDVTRGEYPTECRSCWFSGTRGHFCSDDLFSTHSAHYKDYLYEGGPQKSAESNRE